MGVDGESVVAAEKALSIQFCSLNAAHHNINKPQFQQGGITINGVRNPYFHSCVRIFHDTNIGIKDIVLANKGHEFFFALLLLLRLYAHYVLRADF